MDIDLSKATPRPWGSSSTTVYARQETGEYRDGKPVIGYRFFADVSAGYPEATLEELVANAELMRQAPELLERAEKAEARCAELVALLEAWISSTNHAVTHLSYTGEVVKRLTEKALREAGE